MRSVENLKVMSASVSIRTLPSASKPADAAACVARLREHEALKPHIDNAAEDLVTAIAGNAPYLARLLERYPEQLVQHLAQSPDAAMRDLLQNIHQLSHSLSQTEWMAALRHLKARVAITVALADIAGAWRLEQVTHALSDFAQASVAQTLRYLLRQAALRGDLEVNDEHPEAGTGIIVLGMGKLGGRELNYSSDIDLIALFDPAQLPYKGARNPQVCVNKLIQDLVQILEQRTSDGYVFRTDLRLRPDPMSTPIAVNVAAALSYYETVGQNWERAAMIKARPIAGDIAAGTNFMRELIPFVWRKSLDFATIADIHSIKRQMSVTTDAPITLPDHNIKTGRGGIREIEFFVATQQLVWGGRIPELRIPATLPALDALTQVGLVKPEQRDTLRQAYYYLRALEHRLQMRHDEQTHSLPAASHEFDVVARFMGYQNVETFAQECHATLSQVHAIYSGSMKDNEPPLAVDGNLVFTGVEADPETLATLERLGYVESKRVSDIIQGWHRGHRRSTRSKRSRQVLTELVPALLTAFAKTANPDSAFTNFDAFIDRLPSGAQIFSLFASRPELLALLADILGSAPALGETLSKDPSLLDGVLEADFFVDLPTREELENLLTDRLRYTHDYEQKMGYLRIFNNEKRFQAGVHLLKRITTPKRVGTFLSDLAEVLLQSTMQEVWAEYARTADIARNTPFVVLGFGKLGGREMTFDSDLDIVFLYGDGEDAASDIRAHLHRISQRLVSALTLLTREGRLYEVDTRLRPGGTDGPLATSLEAFDTYFETSAWTYEHMALTRARVVATNDTDFATSVETVVKRHVLKPRENESLLRDVLEMRERIAKQFATTNPWALKHVRGGMVDIDFIAQYLVLRHGASHPALWHSSARRVFEHALNLKLVPAHLAKPLIEAKKFLSDLLSLLRVSAPGGLITDEAPSGLKRLLVEGMRLESFEALKENVIAHEARVMQGMEAMASGKLG